MIDWHKMKCEIYLQWYRDRGKGQEASRAMGAEEVMDGSSPVAVLSVSCQEEVEACWDELYLQFGVNAMTYVICY